MAQPIYRANLPYGPGVPYCSDDPVTPCPLMRTHEEEDLSKCDHCTNYPYKKPIYTHAEWEKGAAKNLQRRMDDILIHLEDILSEEKKDNIAKKVAEKIIVERFFIKPKKQKKKTFKKKFFNRAKYQTLKQEFIHTVKNIPLPSSGKKYCLGCLYLPSNCLCGVKEEGKLTEINPTDKACTEYIEKVF